VIDSADLGSQSEYVLSWSLPPSSLGTPEGGYDVFIDGVDTNEEHRTASMQTQIDNLNTSVTHCFEIQARWTQVDDLLVSNEICVPPQESTSPTVEITITTVNSDGVEISGKYITLYKDGKEIDSGYAPETFEVNSGETYQVKVHNYKGVNFDYWDDGSNKRDRTFTISADTEFIATYKP